MRRVKVWNVYPICIVFCIDMLIWFCFCFCVGISILSVISIWCVYSVFAVVIIF